MITRLHRIQERIAIAARLSGREPDAVTLVAVSKTWPVETLIAAIEAGALHLGENRVQEAEEKIAQLGARFPHVHWHLIGHLQRNKAKIAAPRFHLIHSLDSLRLAETLDRYVMHTAPLPVLLQVNVSGEASKAGFDLPGGIENQAGFECFLLEVAAILALPKLHVQGLMTIAPFADDPEAARPAFRMLRLLRDELQQHFPQADWRHLSMGMSDDFEVAIEEGSTLVRVGRAIFSDRE